MNMAGHTGGTSNEPPSKPDKSLQYALTAAVANFKMAMDRCMHMEKKFLQNIAPGVEEVSPTDVCLAHVLTKTQESFRGPEEWEYILKNSVEPKLETALNVLRSKDKESSEFATLYSALSRHLFSVFLHLHQVRRLQMCSEVSEELRNIVQCDGGSSAHIYALLEATALNTAPDGSVQAAEDNCTKLSHFAVRLSASLAKSDITLVGGTEIAVDKLGSIAQLSPSIGEVQACEVFSRALSPVIGRFN
jgi:hypothetical protein